MASGKWSRLVYVIVILMLVSFSNVQAKDLFEYQWPQESGADWFMLQEQISTYLEVKSFKRKYPGIVFTLNIQTGVLLSIYLNVFPPFTTYIICSSHLLMFLGSIYCKQYGSRSDCSKGSSQFKVYIVCFHDINLV